MIPQQFIDSLLERADIVSVIESRIPLKRAGREYYACCPFHAEKTASFTVTPHKQFFHCFGCGKNGSAIGFLMEFEQLTFPAAVEALARFIGMEMPKDETPMDNNKPLYDLLEAVGNYYERNLRQQSRAIEYLIIRGINGDTAAKYGIGYSLDKWGGLLNEFGKDFAGKKNLLDAGLIVEKEPGVFYDRFRNRIMFPIRNMRGLTIGFGGRAIGIEEKPKYMNSPETVLFHKGSELYGFYEARRYKDSIFVVEGYMDVAMLSQNGIPNVVATLGTATTQDHIRTLFKSFIEIVFCFDADKAGLKAAWKALEAALPELDGKHRIKFLFLPDGEDPDSYIRKFGTDRFNTIAKSAVPLSTYLLETLQLRYDVDNIDGRAQMIEEAKSIIEKTRNGIFKQLLIGELAKITQLTPQQLGAR